MHLLQHFKELTLRPKNAQELKGLVLQLAIQGKLTSKWRLENPNPQPVSSLLNEVQKEKEKLIKERKIKKENTTEKSKINKLPFNLPNNWKWCKLIELSSINGGFAFKSTNYLEEGARVIRISDFDENGFKNHKIVRHIYTDELNSYVLENKNILIAMTGGTVGKSLFVNQVPEIMIVNQRVATIKVFKPIYEAYINCVIPTKLIQDVIKEAKNSTNDNISMSDIKGFNIPLPPLEEQKAIVATVETLFKEIEQLEQLTVERISLKEKFVVSALSQLTTNNTNKEWAFLQEHFHSFFNEKNNVTKFRETILQLAVQGKLTLSWRSSNRDFEDVSVLIKRIQKEKAQLIKDKKIKREIPLPAVNKDKTPYEIPESWIWCRLEDLATITGGVTKGKRNQKDLINSPYLRVANVQRGFLNLELMKDILVSKGDFQKYQLKENDLLIIEGGDPDKVGRCAIWSSEILGCIYQNHVFRVRPFLDSTMNNHFFMQFINSRITRDYYESCAKRTTNLASINKTQMRSTPIVFPPLDEQNVIVEKVNILMSLCDALETEIDISQEQSEKLMQSVLREVFENSDSL